MVSSNPTNSELEIPDSLFETAKMFWRYFVVAWVFPVVLVYAGIGLAELEHPLIFFMTALPLLFWSFFRASRPWMGQRVQFWYSATLGIVFPLLVCAGTVLVNLNEIVLLVGT
jgi:hypothetical protein